MFQFLQKGLLQLGRLLRSNIVHFHFTCLGTEIFLQEPVAEILGGGGRLRPVPDTLCL